VDTRTKILTAEEAGALGRGSEQVVLATGYFDVLLAAHLRDLERVRESLPEDAVLLVALGTPEQPLLDGRARAEVVAALAVVDYVVSLEKQQMERLLPVFPEQRRVRLEAAHQERMRELIEHVHRRQSQ
jgi:bifunctional ADP-heptose synthase (sugar kinase/adenylyltransferase)